MAVKLARKHPTAKLSNMDDFAELPIPPKMDDIEVEFQAKRPTALIPPSPKGRTMEPLTLKYIAQAVASMTRPPSPSIKNENFRTDLMMWRDLTVKALENKNNTPGIAALNVMMALASTSGGLMSVRYIRTLGNQVLWQAAVDVARDRRNDTPLQDNVFDIGSGTVDARHVAPPTELEARNALIETNFWLSSIVDQITIDENERIFLGVDGGLEFTQIKHDDGRGAVSYEPVFDIDVAIEHQIAANEASLAKRSARVIEQRKEAFAALASLVGQNTSSQQPQRAMN